MIKGKDTIYRVYFIEKDKKILANQFQTKGMAILYKASLETQLTEKNIKIIIVKIKNIKF